ncbi:MAG: pyruvate dehydrogenase (acetyl-transferring) E1 component subunit alpha [Hydrogenophaga sp.]|uniref:pyruvate dehydrogenase (acetyl-transferring) E1 component subunit alpha n=1 Tax=Hydrogenophaga sp. TaxID=1904254 RepID=UPI00260CF4BA|nr:pyruvate dehydrogenase (acetyl-transferring) E1 component subunit alpha [Hydrogenophaga sp.]MDM7944108.1 pyruvate dehydrogenase (acetyl-transferring) E1 component subunit alpha [Hydrogenophaga sp.]
MTLSADDAATWLHQMLRIRRFEERCAELYGAGKIRGFLHLYIGEEAIAAAAVPELRADDHLLCTYREHGHALARGVSMRSVMAEMFGRQEGCSHGRGGSMHLFDVSRRFFGGNAIVAGALPMAAGFALADQLLGNDRVTACFFGEGAMAEGEFHETANLAALWHLPLLLMCENNLYAMGTSLARSESSTDLCAKARSYNMEAIAVNGMNVSAVSAAARHALAHARARKGPVFLELRTYRFRAHSMFDPELYRSKAEVDTWKQHDPIDTLMAHATSLGLRLDRAALEARVQTEIDDAVAFAEAGTLEPLQDLTRHVLADAGASGMPC